MVFQVYHGLPHCGFAQEIGLYTLEVALELENTMTILRNW